MQRAQRFSAAFHTVPCRAAVSRRLARALGPAPPAVLPMIDPHLLPPSRFERTAVALFPGSEEASRAVAGEISALIRAREKDDRPIVLGLATGSTPVSVYAELVRLHREAGLSFRRVVTFNLDEYYGLPPEHPQSYRRFMQVHLFDHVDIPPENTHVPSGTVPKPEVDAHCADYERRIGEVGGIDLQILGIGRTGHIGFNEPGSLRRSRTRLVSLDPLTRRDAAGDFGGEEHTPRQAITMGVGTILDARRVMLMAWGRHKADIVRTALEDEPTPRVTASFLQEHEHARFILDPAAASALTRHRTPWRLGPLEDQGLAWDRRMTRRAILWLSRQHQRAILKLTDDDYNDAGLQDLLRVYGSAYEANLEGFYQLQHTITGWPGGRDPQRMRPGDAPVRPLRGRAAEVFPKRVLVLSPHPDDDVIGMGGTLCRLVDQGHEVHVAYQVSGANAVSDDALWRALTFARELPGGVNAAASAWCDQYEAGSPPPDSPEIVRWRALIRRQEAIAAARVCGVSPARLHFLNLPFHDSQVPRRRQLSDADIGMMRDVFTAVRPHLIYAAGDLDDPHGTHRLCLRALRETLAGAAAEPWLHEAELWLYRGAWAAWELDEIDLAVPLSPQEVLRRRRAIFRHESQKDQALFLGEERREFWQRSEERARHLAEAYNALGLAEYEAIEAFKRFTPQEFIDDAWL